MSTSRRYLCHLLPIAFICWLLTTSCTHNNGNIGPLFGKWKLESVEGGTDQNRPLAGHTMFWSFQAAVINITSVNETGHWSDDRYGMFREDDNTLFLTFPDTTLNEGEPPLGLPRECEMQILRIDGKRLTLCWHATPDDAGVVYNFRKW